MEILRLFHGAVFLGFSFVGMVDMLYYKQADTPEELSALIRCFLVSKT